MKSMTARKPGARKGRPPLKPALKRSEHIALMATPAQRAALEKKHASEAPDGVSLSEWALGKLLETE